jgi:hypothetical protein
VQFRFKTLQGNELCVAARNISEPPSRHNHDTEGGKVLEIWARRYHSVYYRFNETLMAPVEAVQLISGLLYSESRCRHTQNAKIVQRKYDLYVGNLTNRLQLQTQVPSLDTPSNDAFPSFR